MTQYHEIRASNLSIRNESWSAKRLQPRLCFDFPSAASAHLNFFPERNVCLSSRSCSSKPRMVTCALIDRRVQLIDCCQAHTADSYVLQEKVSIYRPLYLWCLIIAESVKTFCRVPFRYRRLPGEATDRSCRQLCLVYQNLHVLYLSTGFSY